MKKIISIIIFFIIILMINIIAYARTSISQFQDITPDSWSYDAIEYVYSHKIMNGYNSYSFGPKDNVTRGMLICIIYNLEGQPQVSGTSKFPDVKDKNKYYFNAILWAENKNIVMGYDNGNFGPNDLVTREQMAVFLQRYISYKKMNVNSNNFQKSYNDINSISSYAKDSLKWANSNFVINGDGNNNLRPKDNAKREEVAAMFWNLNSHVIKKYNNSSWIVTQYGRQDDGSQSMGYSIEGNDGGLIIVDGGLYDDETRFNEIKKVLKQNNNTVDTWILTHYDTDHAGIYMAIRDKLPGIKVKNLYVQGFPNLDLLKQKAPWEGDWSLYERYCQLPSNERTIVHDGFEVNNIIGLRFKVLSVYDSWMDSKLNSLLNNGSMIFKLYANNESFLFCGDVSTTVVENRIKNSYKNDLPSTYIQMAHHGNAVFSKSFYEIVKPKVAFFDAPKWLYDNFENVGWYTIKNNRKMLEEMGVSLKKFESGKNVVVMR